MHKENRPNYLIICSRFLARVARSEWPAMAH